MNYNDLRRAIERVGEVPCESAPDLMFHEEDKYSTTNNKLAKKICQGCPIIAECLQYALDNNETYGTWGGKTASERSNIKRAATRRSRSTRSMTHLTVPQK